MAGKMEIDGILWSGLLHQLLQGGQDPGTSRSLLRHDGNMSLWESPTSQ